MTKAVLVIADDPSTAAAIRRCLERDGYSAEVAPCAIDGLRLTAFQPFDAVLLDLDLPGLPGLEVCRRIRDWSQIPIMVITGSRTLDDKVALLDAGADQFLEKPFAPDELLARLRAAIRHRPALTGTELPVVRFADVEVDLASRRVHKSGQQIKIPPRDYGVLAELAKHHDRVVTSTQLLRTVWGHQYATENNYLWVAIRHSASPSNRTRRTRRMSSRIPESATNSPRSQSGVRNRQVDGERSGSSYLLDTGITSV
jgi:two-component system, OmpR family, KDP operon response regulator KdpE